jgi:hypothetical protein
MSDAGRQPYEGGCLCGAIRYIAEGPPLASGACYCRDCQYACGGAPAHGLRLRRDRVALTAGEPRVFYGQSAAGNRVARHFCGDCGTPLFVASEAAPRLLSVLAGSLDDPSRFRPGGSLWVDSAQPWHVVDDKLPQWTGSAL